MKGVIPMDDTMMDRERAARAYIDRVHAERSRARREAKLDRLECAIRVALSLCLLLAACLAKAVIG